MRRLVIACFCAALCSAAALPAQLSVRSVSAVRLTIHRVDQVALDFGVDTSALRRQVVQRLSGAGVKVVSAAELPELAVEVRVPKLPTSGEDSYLLVQMELREPSDSALYHTIWRAPLGSTRFTRFGSLRELVPSRVSEGLDALIVAHANAGTR